MTNSTTVYWTEAAFTQGYHQGGVQKIVNLAKVKDFGHHVPFNYKLSLSGSDHHSRLIQPLCIGEMPPVTYQGVRKQCQLTKSIIFWPLCPSQLLSLDPTTIQD